MARRQVLTMKQMEDIIESWSDNEDEIHTVTVLPPDNVDAVSDEEMIDDEAIPMNTEVKIKSKKQLFCFFFQCKYFVILGKCNARSGWFT